MVAVLEMTTQSDEILRILSNYGRSMKKGELRRQTGLRMYEISSILEDLEREGKIRIDGTIISLI
jgi:DNA-binding IclR family transcriptional regulator